MVGLLATLIILACVQQQYFLIKDGSTNYNVLPLPVLTVASINSSRTTIEGILPSMTTSASKLKLIQYLQARVHQYHLSLSLYDYIIKIWMIIKYIAGHTSIDENCTWHWCNHRNLITYAT